MYKKKKNLSCLPSEKASWAEHIAPRPMRKKLSANTFVRFSDDQKAAYIAFEEKQNTLITGSAGTGKSELLKAIIAVCPASTTAITGTTAQCVQPLGGCTIHYWSGIGIGNTTAEAIAKKLKDGQFHKYKPDLRYQTQRKCTVLIIEEVGMLTGPQLDLISDVLKLVREDSRPFGGIQVVLNGDFLQLPPIPTKVPYTGLWTKQARARMVYDAKCWNTLIQRIIIMRQKFRQSQNAFITLLDHMRVGIMTLDDQQMCVDAMSNKLVEINGILPTTLCATREGVALINEERLSQQPCTGAMYPFPSKDTGPRSSVPYEMEAFNKECMAPALLNLRVGAQVIVNKNLGNGMVNGTRGVVVKFEQMKETLNDSPTGLFPVIKLENGTMHHVGPVKFDNITPDGSVTITRFQVPLNLAWSLTFHKVQGMTLERGKVDAANIWENGQLFVAMSRFKKIEGVQLMNFKRSALKTDMTTVAWYELVSDRAMQDTAAMLHLVDKHFPNLSEETTITPYMPSYKTDTNESTNTACGVKRKRVDDEAEAEAKPEPDAASASASASVSKFSDLFSDEDMMAALDSCPLSNLPGLEK